MNTPFRAFFSIVARTCILGFGVLVLVASTAHHSSAPFGAASSATTAQFVRADTSRPDLDMDDLVKRIHQRVNEARKAHNVVTLDYDPAIEPLAETHSEDMAERDFFGHQNPDGAGVADRARRLNLTCIKRENQTKTRNGFGENLFTGTLYRGYREMYENGRKVDVVYDWHTESSLAEVIVDGWMNSPGHRRNLLDSTYDDEAIAVATVGEKYYVTQVFC